MSKYETIKTNKYIDAKPKSMIIEKRAMSNPVENKFFQKIISPSNAYNTTSKNLQIKKAGSFFEVLENLFKSLGGTPEGNKVLMETLISVIPSPKVIYENPELMKLINDFKLPGNDIIEGLNKRISAGIPSKTIESIVPPVVPPYIAPAASRTDISIDEASLTNIKDLLDRFEKNPLGMSKTDEYDLKVLAKRKTGVPEEYIIRAKKIRETLGLDGKSRIVSETKLSPSTSADLPYAVKPIEPPTSADSPYAPKPIEPKFTIDPTTGKALIIRDVLMPPSTERMVSETLIPDAGIVDSTMVPETPLVTRFTSPLPSIYSTETTPLPAVMRARQLNYLNEDKKIFKIPNQYRVRIEDALDLPGKDGTNLVNTLDDGVLKGYISSENANQILINHGLPDRIEDKPTPILDAITPDISSIAGKIKSTLPKMLNAAGKAGDAIKWSVPRVVLPAAVFGAAGYQAYNAYEKNKRNQLDTQWANLQEYNDQLLHSVGGIGENGEEILIDTRTNKEIPSTDINGNKRTDFINRPINQNEIRGKLGAGDLKYPIYEEQEYADPLTGKTDPSYKILRQNNYDSNLRQRQEVGRFGAGFFPPNNKKLTSILDMTTDPPQWAGKWDTQSKNLKQYASGGWYNPKPIDKRMNKSFKKKGEVSEIVPGNLALTTAPRFSVNSNLLNLFRQFKIQTPDAIQNPMLNTLMTGMNSNLRGNVGTSLFEAAFGDEPKKEKTAMDKLTDVSNAILNAFQSSGYQKNAVLKTINDVGGKINVNGNKISVMFPAAITAQHLYEKLSREFDQEEIGIRAEKQAADIAKAPAYLQEKLKRSVSLDNIKSKGKFDREQLEMMRAGGQSIQEYEKNKPNFDINAPKDSEFSPLRSTSQGFFQPSQQQVVLTSREDTDKYQETQNKKAVNMINGKYKPKSKIEELQLIGTAQSLDNKQKQSLAQTNAARAITEAKVKAAQAKAKADAEAAARRNKTKNDTLNAYRMMGMAANPITSIAIPKPLKDMTAKIPSFTPPLSPSALAISAPPALINPIIQVSPYQAQMGRIQERQKQMAINSQIMQLIADKKL